MTFFWKLIRNSDSVSVRKLQAKCRKLFTVYFACVYIRVCSEITILFLPLQHCWIFRRYQRDITSDPFLHVCMWLFLIFHSSYCLIAALRSSAAMRVRAYTTVDVCSCFFGPTYVYACVRACYVRSVRIYKYMTSKRYIPVDIQAHQKSVCKFPTIHFHIKKKNSLYRNYRKEKKINIFFFRKIRKNSY